MLPKLRDLLKSNPLDVVKSLEDGINDLVNMLDRFDKAVTAFDRKISQIDRFLSTGFVRREEEKREEKKESFVDHLKRAMMELEIARSKVTCPNVQNIIDEIILFAEGKLKDLAWIDKNLVKVVEQVLKEEGVEDWTKLSESEKKIIKEKIKQRLRGDRYG